MDDQGTPEQVSDQRPDHKGRYSSVKDNHQKDLDSLLFDALKIQPFGRANKLVMELLDEGVPITIKDKAESTPLAVAVKQKCPVDVISRLMPCNNAKLLMESQNKHKLTAVHEAALVNNHEALLVIINELREGAALVVNTTNMEEQIRSCHYGQPDTTSSCYKILNKKNKEGWTALHYAADRGHVEVLHLLLLVEHCNVIATNKLKKTAFHLAAKRGYLLCLQLLFAAVESRGLLGSLPKVDKNEWNLACHASAQLKCDIKVMEWLLRNMPEHTDINHATKKGYTPLLLACEYQNFELVQLLLNHEQLSELMAVTDDGKTALHLAAIHDSVEIIRLLIDKGVPINDIDNEDGETALHIACKKGSHEVENVLVSEGADQTIKSKDGKLPEEVKYSDLRIPAEIKKRGDRAIEGYITALKKGKKKMPRCKLVILGEAGVGKTNLLNLLTGEKFVPTHEKTEGVEISLVNTFDIDTEKWKKSQGGGGYAEYRKIAAIEVANQLKDTKPDEKTDTLPSIEDLERKFKLIMKKYPDPKPTSKPAPYKHMANSHFTRSGKRSDDYFQISKVQSAERSSEQPALLEAVQPRKVDTKEKQKASVDVPSSNPPSTQIPSQAGVTSVVVTSKLSLPSSTEGKDTHASDTQTSKSSEIPNSHDNLHITILRDAVKRRSSKPLTVHLKLTSFDFAGQDHYKSMHPCFMTSRAIYIITFNARHLLPESECSSKCVGDIKYWVNSVLVHIGKDAEVILVGTHKGPYFNGDDSFDLLNENQAQCINKDLKAHLKNYRSVFSFFKGNKIMALVESSIKNTEGGSGAKVVQEKLRSLGEGHPGNKDDLPLSYLRMESRIFEERSKESEFLVPYHEVEQWAIDFGIEGTEDINTALNFLHDIGIIVYPNCLHTLFLTKEDIKPLQGVVLIKPQWLADVMKELMKIDRGDEKFDNSREVREAIDCLLETGKADKQLVLFPLWREHHSGSKQLFEQICLLLEAYGVIIPIKKENEIPQCYYITCKLPQNVEIPDDSDNCHTIYVTFKKGLFPPFVLHQLMFKMFQDYNPSCYEFGNSKCFMEYIQGSQWWLYQQSYDDKIKVVLRTKPHIRTILPAMELLHAILQKILKAEELNSICYELGPVAECSQCEDIRQFSYITYNCENDSRKQKKDGQSKQLQCSCCHNGVPIKCDSETDQIIKSKNYNYGESFEKFKKDLNYDILDDELKIHLNEYFQKDLSKEDATSTTTTTNDGRIIRRWYEQHKKDPWPLVADCLSYYNDYHFEFDRIMYKFLYMHNHCL